MLGEPESFVCNPPAASDATTDRARARTFDVPSSGSTVEIDIGANQCWVTVTSDVDVLMRASFTTGITDCAANDWVCWSKSYANFWVNGDRYWKFGGLGTAGKVRVYVSNR